jgi:hypothetical protein
MSDFDKALSLFGSGGYKVPFVPGKSYGTPPAILNRLIQTESSGNPYAINKSSGAMGPAQFMPQTIAFLHQKGVVFDPFDPNQARSAADWYLQYLKNQNGGDMNKAVAAYGGFVSKDPSGYQSKVLGSQPQQSQQPQQGSDFDGALSLFKNPQYTNQKWTNPQQGNNAQSAPAPKENVVTSSPMLSVGLNQLTGLGAQIVGGWRGLATLATGGTMDDAANDTRQYVGDHTYQPDAGTTGAKAVQAFGSDYNPLTWIPKAANFAGEKTAEVTGSPAIGAAVNTGINAVPLILGAKSAFNTPVKGLVTVAPASEAEMANASAASGIRPIANNPSPSFEAPQGAAQAATQSASTGAQHQQGVPMQNGSAPIFEEPLPTGAQTLPAEVQAQRAKILSDIGIQNARQSAIVGDAKGASTDYQTSKLDTPAGNQMRSVLDAERAALENHAENIIQSTGGTSGLDQGSLYARGNTILQPLNDLKNWFDTKTSQLYQAADQRAQGVPTDLKSFQDTLGDDSMITNSDRVGLRDGTNAYLKKLGVVNDDGSISATAQQAETVRKYLNENWTPANSKFVGALKDSLDNDVMSSAGEDIYGAARQIRALRGQTLDNPNGIAKIIDADGINRSVPVEKIPDAIAGLPFDQFNHVVSTLQNVPEEIQPQAQAALNEIRAHFANNVSATGSKFNGQWNAKGVNKYLQANGSKMNLVMTPEQIGQMDTLNKAGYILGKDQSYPGAAVQGHNLIRSGAMSLVQNGSAAIGAGLGGPVGAAVGNAIGSKAAQAIADKAALSAVNKRIVKLSDFVNTGD